MAIIGIGLIFHTFLLPSSAFPTALDLPPCSLKCFSPTAPSNAFSPGCSLSSGSDFEGTFSPCFYESCAPKEALSALNVTSIICDEPVRDLSRSNWIYSLVLTVVSSGFIGLRLIMKIRGLAGSVSWDDWSIIIAVFLTAIATAGQLMACWFGVGRDEWKIPGPDLVLAFKGFYFSAMAYKLANGAIRISILCFYLRIFAVSNFRLAVLTFIVLNVMISITFAIADALHCHPSSYFWNGWDGEHSGYCLSLLTITWAHSILNVILDVITLGMAVWIIRGLNMRWKQKANVLFMFVLGSFITIISILRLQAVPWAANTRNLSYGLVMVAFWSGAELASGLIFTCLPALIKLRDLFRAPRSQPAPQTNSKGYTKQTDSAERLGVSSKKQPSSKSRDPMSIFAADDDDLQPNTKIGNSHDQTGLVLTELHDAPTV